MPNCRPLGSTPVDGSPAHCDTSEGGSRSAPPLLFAPYRLPAGRYAAAFEQGQSLACRSLVLRWVPNGLSKTCLGVISAKRTFRLAVARSRARRLMREAFRLERPGLREGYDLVLLGRRGLEGLSCHDVRRDLLWLCRKAGLLKQNPHA